MGKRKKKSVLRTETLKTLGPHSSQGPGPAHKSSPWGWVARRAAKTSSNQPSVRVRGVYSRSVQLTDKFTRVIMLHYP